MNPLKRSSWAVAFGLLGLSSVAVGDVTPNPLFSQGAVLQRGRPVPVWGTADDGEKITVTFQDQVVETITQSGKWRVQLAELMVGGPYTMTIEGKNKLEIIDLLVGEVWICSGQSNMGFALRSSTEGKAAIEASDDPQLRLFSVDHAVADEPQAAIKVNAKGGGGIWLRSKPETTARFSAVAYFFGRDLRKTLGVPVGLIHSSWGGTSAECWTSRRALESDSLLKGMLDDYAKALTRYPEAEVKYKAAQIKHREAVAEARAAGKTPPTAPRTPVGPNTPHVAGLYQAMINPLQPYAIRGAIWYQGEDNVSRAFQYRTLFPTMIKNWREDWGQGDFPFLFVQLAPYHKIKPEPAESDLAELREAQALVLKTLPATAMAVITDIGEENDVHPKKKEPVGARLARAAFSFVYGQPIGGSGPLYSAMTVEGDRAILQFQYVGQGLVAKDGPLVGFTIAGDDHKFVPALAEIQGETVVVHADKVTHPVAVRYGWADYPVVNLWNGDGLPASPFRTDDFPMVTAPKAKAKPATVGSRD